MVVTVSINDQYARETKSQLFLHILWCTYDGSKFFLIRYKLEQLSATLHYSSNTSAAEHISADTYSHRMKFIVPEPVAVWQQFYSSKPLYSFGMGNEVGRSNTLTHHATQICFQRHYCPSYFLSCPYSHIASQKNVSPK